MFSTLFPSIKLVAGDSETHSTLSRGESIGLVLRTESGILSAIAALIILVLLFRRVYKDRGRKERAKRDREWAATNGVVLGQVGAEGVLPNDTLADDAIQNDLPPGRSDIFPMQIYVISLFVAEFIQGVANSISMKWVIEGEVNAGISCTTQGALLQMGVLGVSLATLGITVQTFVSIWWLKYPKIAYATGYVVFQWIFIALWVGIGYGVHTHPPSEHYATPTPYWCWIGQHFKPLRLGGEYVWLWLTLFVSIILYPLLFFLRLDKIHASSSWYAPTNGVRRGDRADRLWTAILYPCVYCLVVLPLSVVRWIGFRQADTTGVIHVSPVVTFLFANIFALSGVFNAAMYPLTRSLLFEDKSNNS